MLHLEEEQVGQFLDIVAIGHTIVAQNVTIVPEFLYNILCVGTHNFFLPFFLRTQPAMSSSSSTQSRSRYSLSMALAVAEYSDRPSIIALIVSTTLLYP